MDFYLEKIFTVLLFVEIIVGIVINMFFVVVQLIRGKTLKSLEPCNRILTCLGISRSLFLTNSIVFNLLKIYFQLRPEIPLFYLVIWVSGMVLHYANLWITTVLCVFYCLKIASYSCTLFIFMKTRISRLVPQFIVASLLISVASSLPYGFYVFWLHQQNAAYFSLGDVTLNITDFQEHYPDQVIILSFGSLLPFLIFCGAIYLLIGSIWRHARQMRSSRTSFRSPNLEAHFDVVKSMILFLLCQLIYFVCMIFLYSSTLSFEDPLRDCLAIVICFPSCLHSAHMIYSNAKLKQSFIKMWHGLLRGI